MVDKSYTPPLAYEDGDFLHSRSARSLRILSEYSLPDARFDYTRVRDTIVVFGSARIPSAEAAAKSGKTGGIWDLHRYYEDARELSHRLTDWSKSLDRDGRRFVICTGGGPGIMEAANRGASEAKGMNVGLGIELPFEAENNPYITRQLSFSFHYFFTRKFWFVYLAKAIIIMPGGFGTMDELFEILTLEQCGKIRKQMAIVLYGSEFWKKIINFEALAEFGVIDREDLDLFHFSDTVDDAYTYVTDCLTRDHLSDPRPSM